eukprot:m.3488 g.3488  ORF g.3488 m.3488 type:complete len:203 (-) comp2780_c0_seq1:174-782(-)
MDEGVKVLEEFLEAALHTILFVRNVYPAELFERRKKYEVPIQMSRHPELNSYILSVISSLSPWIKQGIVDKVSVVITNENRDPLERFLFELLTPAEWENNVTLSHDELERALRGFLLKLSISDAFLSPLPKDCTFAILVHTHDTPATQQDWVSAGPDMTEQQHPNAKSAVVVPLKSAHLGFTTMQLVVQESEFKTKQSHSIS